MQRPLQAASRRVLLAALLVAGLAAAGSSLPAEEGVLDQIRAATQSGGGGGDSGGNHGQDGSRSHGGGGGGCDALGDVLGDLLQALFSGGSSSDGCTDGEYHRQRRLFYLPYPYANRTQDFICFASEIPPPLDAPVAPDRPFSSAEHDPFLRQQAHEILGGGQPGDGGGSQTGGGGGDGWNSVDTDAARMAVLPHRDFSIQCGADDSQDFAERLNTMRTTLRIDWSSGWGLDGTWAYLHESRLDGTSDSLQVGEANLDYSVLHAPGAQLRLGGGLTYMEDGPNSATGLDCTASVDIFPFRPVVVSAVADVGSLGNATYYRLRGQVGVMVNRFEAYAGYDYVSIGGVPIQGPVLGLRVWF
ncbi:MAG: hypothetical protein ACREJ2_11815 [Planctomycetota bacterium]